MTVLLPTAPAVAPFLDEGGVGFARAARKLRLAVFDFDGVFTDNAVYVLEDGTEMVRCTRADGVGLKALRRLGVDCMIVSTETNPVVQARARKLGVACHVGCDDKRALLTGVLAERELSWEQVSFLGNDVNDLDCLRAAGLSVAVVDAHPTVFPHVSYRTRCLGGHGAVREFCDLVCRMRGAHSP